MKIAVFALFEAECRVIRDSARRVDLRRDPKGFRLGLGPQGFFWIGPKYFESAKISELCDLEMLQF